MRSMRQVRCVPIAGFLALMAGMLRAQEALKSLPIAGRPHQGGTGFQLAASSEAAKLQWLDGFILVIVSVIVLLVLALLAICIFRFNHRANPTPARFTHNSPLEITWTIVPVLILVFIGAFSLPILFDQQEIPDGDITVKVTGYQWYWHYDYVDEEFGFDSYMIGQPATGGNYQLTPEVEAMLVKAGYSRDEFLLAVDNPLVVPVGKVVVVQVTGGDVIHSWTVPALGVKQDGVPGRLAELWFRVDKPGVYFGQCSELCGKDHAFMPVTVKAVDEASYAEWLGQAKQLFAGTPAVVKLARAE